MKVLVSLGERLDPAEGPAGELNEGKSAGNLSKTGKETKSIKLLPRAVISFTF